MASPYKPTTRTTIKQVFDSESQCVQIETSPSNLSKQQQPPSPYDRRIKEEPTSGDECDCAECRGEVVITGERSETEGDEIEVEVNHDDVQPQDQIQNESEANSKYPRSISSVDTPGLVQAVASNLDGESSGNKKSKYDFPKLNSNQVLCRSPSRARHVE